jgi:type I restriction enzyme S subunit
LHTILDLPVGTFVGVGQKTVVLFFEKGKPTNDIWYYELKVGRSLGKRDPINYNDFQEFIDYQKDFIESDNSWKRSKLSIDKNTFDLSVNNPNKKEDIIIRNPAVIIDELEKNTSDTTDIIKDKHFLEQINELSAFQTAKWEKTTLGHVCDFFNGKAHEKEIDANGDFIVVNSKFISRDGDVKKFTMTQIFPLFENDIVLVMSDVPNGKALGKCFLIDEDEKYSLNQRICAIRSNNFNPKFLYYQLNRNKHFLSFNNGENQTNLRKEDILNCPLFMPPMEEQNRIVEILDKLKDESSQVIFNINNKTKLAEEFQQSILGIPFLI